MNPEPTAPDPAARLCEAAALIRKHATDATPGICPGYVRSAVRHVARNCDIHCGHDEHYEGPDEAIWDRYNDAPWIALVHPGVGEALAAWLESVAERLTATTHPEWQATFEPHALAVADQILGKVTR